jgi:multidrug efflux pump subunit AcrA (membrane-fusion protein)
LDGNRDRDIFGTGGLHRQGRDQGKDEARLSFKVGGVIEFTHVEEGQNVKAGKLLAVLRQTEEQVQDMTMCA